MLEADVQGIRQSGGSGTAGSALTNVVIYSTTSTDDFDIFDTGDFTLLDCASGDLTAFGTGAITGVVGADFVDYQADFHWRLCSFQ